MNYLLVFLVGGAFTLATRLSFIYLQGRWRPPETMQRMLRFVPAAVLSAIIAPELLLHSGALDLSRQNSRLIAGIVAILVAWWTRNTLVTILVGFGCLLALELIF